jgi:CRP/FNR family cyclic AMP-dependent transcriptional regulator
VVAVVGDAAHNWQDGMSEWGQTPGILAGTIGTSRGRRLAQGGLLFAASDDADSVYILLAGTVRLYRLSSAGGEVAQGYVSAGEVLGEGACFGELQREGFAEAVAEIEYVEIPSERFRSQVLSQPQAALDIARQLYLRLNRTEARLESRALQSVRARVAQALLQLVSQFGSPVGQDLLIDLPVTQTQLAALAGTTRQTANQHLRALERDGSIRQLAGRIVVCSRGDLARTAGEERELET